MADLGPALVGLCGAVFGAGTAASVAWLSWKANTRQRRQERHEDREEQLRALAADAYVDAHDGLEWLHPNNVEDSVLDPWRADYGPRNIRSLELVRSASRDMDRLAALAPPGQLSEAAAAAGRALRRYEYSWNECIYHADRMYNQPDKNKAWSTAQFEKHFSDLHDLRAELTGRTATSRRQEVDEGNSTTAGLLADVRRALGRASVGSRGVQELGSDKRGRM